MSRLIQVSGIEDNGRPLREASSRRRRRTRESGMIRVSGIEELDTRALREAARNDVETLSYLLREAGAALSPKQRKALKNAIDGAGDDMDEDDASGGAADAIIDDDDDPEDDDTVGDESDDDEGDLDDILGDGDQDLEDDDAIVDDGDGRATARNVSAQLSGESQSAKWMRGIREFAREIRSSPSGYRTADGHWRYRFPHLELSRIRT